MLHRNGARGTKLVRNFHGRPEKTAKIN